MHLLNPSTYCFADIADLGQHTITCHQNVVRPDRTYGLNVGSLAGATVWGREGGAWGLGEGGGGAAE